MQKDAPLYSNRITRNYLDYLSRHHPDCEIDDILLRSGMTRYEVADPAHWFTQGQMDRFHEILVRETGNPNISRDVGRASAQSESMGMAKQYVLGMMTPASVYMLMGKVMPLFSRHMRIETRKRGPRLIEVISKPYPGVQEKPYQCQNRLGSLEAVTLPFINRLARVEHPDCVHEGAEACRYLIHLPRMTHLGWKQARNAVGLAALAAFPIAALTTPLRFWVPLSLAGALTVTIIAWIAERLEKKNVLQTLKVQGEAAKGQIDEMKHRATHAQLVQEIGAAASSIQDEKALIRALLDVMERRLEFERGLFLLVSEGDTVLAYAGCYGYGEEERTRLSALRIRLDEATRKGLVLKGLPDRTTVLLDTPEHGARALPPDLAGALEHLGIRDCICAPLLYEREVLGLLLFHHVVPGRPVTVSDLTLLEGVASNTAVGIVNARSYRKLEVSERTFRELVQGASSAILRSDPQGKLTFINRFAENLFGFSKEEIVGKHVIGTILPDEETDRRGLARLLARLQEDPERPRVTETRNLHRSGREIWIAWTYRPMFGDDGTLREVLAIGNDITELRAARKEKEILASRLERSGRMEAVGTLAGGVAHELNNILSGIVSYPELLLMDLPADSSWRKPVETIQRAGEKAAKIVQDLLLLSRRGVSVTEPLTVNRIVRTYLDGREHRELTARHTNVRVDLSLPEGLPPIPASQERLIRALQSLVHYGFQAMPEGGALRIETEHVSLTREYVGYEPVKPGDYVLLRVSDEGPALTWDHLERIFEPFYATKMLKRPGTGLGLPVVWGIVKDCGGFVDVRTRPEIGTAFTLYLPAAKDPGGTTGANDAGQTSILGRGESVLVVDDIPDQRIIAERILSRLNYRPVTLESGEAAVAYLEGHDADLVILDMVMEPGMDGLDTFRAILAARPGQKAILASGYSENDRVREARRLGAGAYLKKPYNVETLGRAVRAELDREGG